MLRTRQWLRRAAVVVLPAAALGALALAGPASAAPVQHAAAVHAADHTALAVHAVQAAPAAQAAQVTPAAPVTHAVQATHAAPATATAVAAHAAHIATAAPNAPPPPCAAGYAPITSWNVGQSITGDGVNVPVFLGAGNCFQPLNHFTYQGFSGYQYQNGDGHCLWLNGITVELGGACVAGHANEEFYGIAFVNGEGWTIANVGHQGGLMRPSACSDGSEVQILNSSSCVEWSST